jgi:3-oxoadipate enol-lactonase
MRAHVASILLSAAVVTAAAQTGPSSGTASVNGATLHYEVTGTGYPLVLIHGGAVDMRVWDDQVRDFSRDFRVIRYDLRGAGGSSDIRESFSNTEDLHALLRFLKVDRAHLLGISRGGGIAFDFTLAFPDMVDRLVLVSANLGRTPAAYQKMFEAATEAGKKDGAASAASVWGNDPYQGATREKPEARRRVLEIITDNIARFRGFAPGSVRVEQRSLSTRPAYERLSDIRVPTLVIAGANDAPDARANYDRWAAGIPGAKKLVFDGAAHLVPIDQTEKFNKAVREFLQPVSPSRE